MHVRLAFLTLRDCSKSPSLYPESVSELILIAPALSGFPYSAEFLEYINQVNAAAPDIDKMIEISQSAPLYNGVVH